MMYNSNGPPRGFNVTQDQSSYDIVFKDIIICNQLGTNNGTYYTYNLGTDSINLIYKAEVVSATINFVTSIPTNIKNRALLVSIPQLNGNTTRVAGNQITSSQGNNNVQGVIFCQIPDNNTPLVQQGVTSNNTIHLFIGPHMYDSIQFYNPPISKINKLDISFFDTQANPIPVGSSSGNINTFYMTIRIYYLNKRYNTSTNSVPVVIDGVSGTSNSWFSTNN